MENLWYDLRYGLRIALKNRGVTLLVVLALALGIGANVAIFSVVNSVLLRPLPYDRADQLVMIWDNFLRLGMQKLGVAPSEFVDYKRDNKVFEDIGVYGGTEFSLMAGDTPERLVGERVSANLFPLLGVTPVRGRTFVAEEDQAGAGRVAILSHELWQRRFGGRPEIVGQSVTLNGNGHTVVGVMPPNFQVPHQADAKVERADVWVPAAFTPQELSSRDSYTFRAVARLKSGVTLAQAQADMDGIAKGLEQQYAWNYRGPNGADGGWKITVVPLYEDVVGKIGPVLYMLLGAVGFVLLIACADVANLLLARAMGRRQEFAVRAAFGAGRGRIIRQLLSESVLLALMGGLLGLLLAYWGMKLLIAISPSDIPRLDETGLDGRVLLFTMAVSLLTGLLFGLAPALRASKGDLSGELREATRSTTAGRGSHRLLSLFIIGEVALALVLLIGAGLLVNSFRRVIDVQPGFDPGNMLTFEMSLPLANYPEVQSRAGFYTRLVDELGKLPGVSSASMVSSVPLGVAAPEGPLSIEGRPFDPAAKPQVVRFQVAGQNYFRTMNIPVQKGRDLSPEDAKETSRVVFVNETLARRFFPGEEAIGRQVKIGAPQAPNPWLTIAGVVGDVKSTGLEADAKPELYLPFIQRPRRSMVLVARTATDPNGLVNAARGVVRNIDPNQPIYNVKTMEQIINGSIAGRRFSMVLLAVLASIALLLAAVGLFGVISYSVAQRTREIGIRMALGARRRDVLKMVLAWGLKITAIGIALGLVGAFALTRILSSLLYGVSATDPLTFLSVALLLLGVALLAAYIPAHKAMKVDPNSALRYE